MHTIEITKSGINRNFLRECEHQGLIKPKRNDSEWIINKKYIPREYSQEELEIVWNTYLYRKMGLSYAQIKELIDGKNISIRDSLNKLIEKYENQIQELLSLINFIKFVKGIGFIPNPPDELIGSKSFKDYLDEFIEYLDKDKKLKPVLEFAEYLSEVNDLEKVTDEEINNIENLAGKISLDFNEKDQEEYSKVIMNLKERVTFDPASKETQTIINQIFTYQKKLTHNHKLSAWDFATGYILMLSNESDISVAYKKILGNDTCNYLVYALMEFLLKNEPKKMQQLYNE